MKTLIVVLALATVVVSTAVTVFVSVSPAYACDDEAAERAARALERIAHDIHNQQ